MKPSRLKRSPMRRRSRTKRGIKAAIAKLCADIAALGGTPDFAIVQGREVRKGTKHQRKNAHHRGYLAWIHSQPCASCGTHQNIQAAHVGRGGMGMKHGSDAEVIPLCGARSHGWMYTEGCHDDHDRCGGQFRLMTREQRQAWDRFQIAAHRARWEAAIKIPELSAAPREQE